MFSVLRERARKNTYLFLHTHIQCTLDNSLIFYGFSIPKNLYFNNKFERLTFQLTIYCCLTSILSDIEYNSFFFSLNRHLFFFILIFLIYDDVLKLFMKFRSWEMITPYPTPHVCYLVLWLTCGSIYTFGVTGCYSYQYLFLFFMYL